MQMREVPSEGDHGTGSSWVTHPGEPWVKRISTAQELPTPVGLGAQTRGSPQSLGPALATLCPGAETRCSLDCLKEWQCRHVWECEQVSAP